MPDNEIFDWFKTHEFNIVISICNKKDPIAFGISKSGEHYTTSGKTVFEVLNNLKELIEG